MILKILCEGEGKTTLKQAPYANAKLDKGICFLIQGYKRVVREKRRLQAMTLVIDKEGACILEALVITKEGRIRVKTTTSAKT